MLDTLDRHPSSTHRLLLLPHNTFFPPLLPPTYDSSARPLSETLVGHSTNNPKLHDQTTVIGHQQIFHPEPMESPVSAETVYGPDYIGMTPPHSESDTSLRSYLKQSSRLIHGISMLPWVVPDRVTVDYPQRSKRRTETERHPVVVWVLF